MHFLAATTIVFFCLHYSFAMERKKSMFAKVLWAFKKKLPCCFMTDKNKILVKGLRQCSIVNHENKVPCDSQLVLYELDGLLEISINRNTFYLLTMSKLMVTLYIIKLYTQINIYKHNISTFLVTCCYLVKFFRQAGELPPLHSCIQIFWTK